MIRLYAGRIIGSPVPSYEIGALHWIGQEHTQDERVSPIIRKKIIPDLVRRNILK